MTASVSRRKFPAQTGVTASGARLAACAPDAPGHIASLVEALRPAVEEARLQAGDVLDNAIRANVKRVVKQLRTTSPILEEKLGRGALKLAGRYHDLDTGVVELLS